MINLASGGIAMFAGYTYWALRTGLFGAELPTAPALVITFVVIVVFGVAMELLAFRPLQAASPLAKLAASLGVLLTLQASMLLSFGDDAEAAAPGAAAEPPGRALGVTFAGLDRLLMAGIVVAAAVGARGPLPLEPVRPRDAGRLGERGLRDARGAVAEQPVDGQHVLACLVAGGLGVLAASITSSTGRRSLCTSSPRSQPRCSRASRRSASPARSGSCSAWRSRCS